MTDLRERFTFRLPKELLEKIRAESNDRGVSMNALLLQILWSYFNEK